VTKIVVICGPTACSKSNTAVQLAKNLDGEIISADSMQIYKYMDIGTAKLMPEEMGGILHYLIDELAPDAPYNAAIFKNAAAKLIDDITRRGKTPIVCGGTGFYINALLYDADLDSDTDSDPAYRAELAAIAAEKGEIFLHNMLKNVDSEGATAVDVNNVKRVIRALEYFKCHGQPISLHNQIQKQKQAAYDADVFVLSADRATLYERVNQRVDAMVEAGLVDEVVGLLEMGYLPNLTSMQGLGYKETIKYLHGECSFDEAITSIKQGTRRFAKRQITWFRHQLKGARWVDVDNQDILNFLLANLEHV